MIEKEELKRMVERPGLNEDGTPIKITKRKKVKRVAQKVVGGVFSNTVGRVGRFASRRLLGRVPETALQGSFQESKPEEENKLLKLKETDIVAEAVAETLSSEQETITIDDKVILEKEISEKIFSEYDSSEADKSMESEMKSDDQLFKEIMAEKERIPVNNAKTTA